MTPSSPSGFGSWVSAVVSVATIQEIRIEHGLRGAIVVTTLEQQNPLFGFLVIERHHGQLRIGDDGLHGGRAFGGGNFISERHFGT